MKSKAIALLVLLALCLGLLSACGPAAAKPTPTKEIDVTTYYERHNFPEEKLSDDEVKITAPAGSVLDVDITFLKYTRMDAPCDKPGTIERLDYTTDVYGDGKTYEKYVNVYLPYGYDQNDTAARYNVLYFQHGNKLNNDYFKDEKYKNWMDNCFASGKVDPVILVFTSYYMVDADEAAEIRKSEADAPAGDGNYEGLPGNFWMEVVQDIIPAVESKYNTYTESFDEDGIIASREHRGFSGYSRGGMCTWYMFHSALPYFKWWSPMSANCLAGRRLGVDEWPGDQAAYEYLKEAIDANPDKDFFIYVGSGGPTDANALRTQVAFFARQDAFSFGSDPTVNNLCYTLSNFEHGDLYVPYYYYNTLRVLFH